MKFKAEHNKDGTITVNFRVDGEVYNQTLSVVRPDSQTKELESLLENVFESVGDGVLEEWVQ